MRTVLTIAIGLSALAVMLLLVLAAGGGGRALRAAAVVFVAGWFVFTLFSFRGGLRAGYSVAEEAPIHLLLFGAPALAAFVAARLLSR